MICEGCGAQVNPRGYAAHVRGTGHHVAVTKAALVARGLLPVAHQYRNWITAAGLELLEGPINWHPGNRASRGTLTHAFYVPAAFAALIQDTDIPARLRKSACVALGRLTPAERDLRLGAAAAVWRLDGAVTTTIDVLTEATP